MIQRVMTVTIGDGRVQKVEWEDFMARYATEADVAEAERMREVVERRVRRFTGRKGQDAR